MLELNIEDLDKDFMILWSRYLLNGTMDMKKLTALAKLGQINAIQEYYLLTDEKNPTIDEIVNGYDKSSGDIDIRLARLNKYFSEHKDEISALSAEYTSALDTNNARTIADARQKLQNNTYFTGHTRIIFDIENKYKDTNNILYLAKANEVSKSNIVIHENEKTYYRYKVYMELLKQYKQNPTDIIKFTLGKHIILFLPNTNVQRQQKLLAERLLEEIAKQPFSDALLTSLGQDDKTV